MNYHILLETSTDECSVALASDCNIVSYRETNEPKSHARLLVPFIKEILDEAHLKLSQCSSVAVSEGPGSYTGLRVGVSTAKGLCFGADIPLIGVCTLDILTRMAISSGVTGDTLIVPMIDARRMEVYCAKYDSDGKRLSETEAKVLDESSFSEELARYSSVVFIGDGAEKFQSCLSGAALEKSKFICCSPSARGMIIPTLDKWAKKEFEDRAYFEPFYLKEFVAGISKKSIF